MFDTHGTAASAVSAAISRFFRGGGKASRSNEPLDGQSVQPDPASPDAAVIWLVSSLRKTGRLDTALHMIQHACQQHPWDADLHVSRGQVLRACRRDAEALEAFETALRLRPEHAEAARNRQKLLDQLAPQ